MNRHFFIAVEGSIGVGKTSLVKILAEHLGGRQVLEEFEENPFLKDFYKDSKFYAFQTQIFFLLSRYRQQLKLNQLSLFDNYVISDYMFAKDRLFASLTLNEDEMNLYDKVAEHLEPNIKHPDLVIFLQSDTERLMQNIRKRGRSYEKNMDWQYIDALNTIYNEYFFHYTKSNLLIVNNNEIDFVENEQDRKDLLDFIQKPFTGSKFYNPTKYL